MATSAASGWRTGTGLFNADTRYLARLELVLDEVSRFCWVRICVTTIPH